MLINAAIFLFVLFSKHEEAQTFNFLKRTLIKFDFTSEWINTLYVFLSGYISMTIVYSYMVYLSAYIGLYQTVVDLAESFHLSQNRLMSEKQFDHFWRQRLAYFDLRERTQKIYSIVSFIFYAALFAVTSAYILVAALLQVNTTRLVIFLALYLLYFAIPTFVSCFVLGNFVDFDERFNRNLFELFNETPSSGNDFGRTGIVNEKRQTYLNHLQMHMRFSITAWDIFEVGRKLPFQFFNTVITFVVMIYNIIKT